MKAPNIENDTIYKALVCNRCKEAVFRKNINSEITDGGFLSKHNFEPIPEGWKFYTSTDWLCPECSKLYNEITENFMKNNLEWKIKISEE